jgi:hypothetical protein
MQGHRCPNLGQYTRIFPGSLNRTTKKPSQHRGFPSRDLNSESPKYEVRLLTT